MKESKQSITGDFVNRNVLGNMTDIVGDLLDLNRLDYFDLVQDAAERDEVPDVFEWWGVTDFLAEKLKEKGEVICDEYMIQIWGRQGCGQAIKMDGVIEEICQESGLFD
jgi:hypothetical protein